MTDKGIILYLEDQASLREIVRNELIEGFPQHRVISTYGGLEEIKEEFKEAGGVEKLVLVCTDGSLCGTSGWDVVSELRDKGYEGPAIYCGGSGIPERYEHLFSASAGKNIKKIVKTAKRLIL